MMPKIRMPAMTSTVITGRRTKSSAIFTKRPSRCFGGLADVDPRAGRKTQLAGDDNLLAGRESTRHDGVIDFGARNLDVAQFDRPVRLDNVDVLTVGAALYRRRWRDDRILLVVERQHDVDELSRPQRLVAIGEFSLELDRSGRHVR